jgi:DNA-directed RNA polymerase sigma subunit (sigma70/sigma32)
MADPTNDLLQRCGRDISQVEQIELVRRWHHPHVTMAERDYCVAQLVWANLKYIRKLGQRFRWLTDECLISAGTVGVIEAIKGFDVTREFTFLTFAHYPIFKAIRNAANEARVVRYPAYLLDQLSKLNRARTEIRRRMRVTEPTVEELALEMDMTVESVARLIQLEQPPISLDVPLDPEEERSTLLDFMVDE